MRLVARVTGVGGVFVRSPDPAALAAWYAEHLGVPTERYGGATFHWLAGATEHAPGSTTWAPFPADTAYFGSPDQQVMINFRVDDLDALLAKLRRAGVEVIDAVDDSEFGRFGWCVDLDGNRVELWQPAEGM
jgi:predicted enzyme related to lactoylglutathione lyase